MKVGDGLYAGLFTFMSVVSELNLWKRIISNSTQLNSTPLQFDESEKKPTLSPHHLIRIGRLRSYASCCREHLESANELELAIRMHGSL